MSQKAKQVTSRGSEEPLARFNMSGQKGRRVKLDASYLLNFTTDSGREHGQYSANSRARKSSAYKRGYTKEHYLLSNAQFVVDQGLDWEGYLSDPDRMLPWDRIRQVRLLSPCPPSCPICLSPPEAARVTRCGHAYCLPCLLHLFSLAANRWDSCPVCGELIRLSDAKPAVSLQQRVYGTGDRVSLVKLGRPALFSYPLPCCLGREEKQLLSSCDKGAQFCKLLASDTQFGRQMLLRDKRELLRAMSNPLSDLVFVQNALDVIELELGETHDSKVYTNAATNVSVDHSQDNLLFELNYAEEFAEVDTSDDIPLSPKRSLEDCIYHYQLSDGQYVFMDPLNSAMLREEFGTLARSPLSIRGRIVSITHHVVTDALRHKYKWLSHLPLMCELQFLEVNLQPPLISNRVMDMFQETVDKRRINRQAKQRQEDISDRKAAAYWNKTYPSLLCETREELPDLSVDSFTPLPSINTSINTSITELNSVPLSSSFAQALSQKAIPSNPVPIPINETISLNETTVQPQTDTHTESDEEFAPPTYSDSMSDAIATKLDAYMRQRELEAVPNSKVPCGPSRGKRGKGKKIVLFSTYAGRPTN